MGENGLEGFHQDLLAWYRSSARDLPWRREPAPYRIWISEMMLQQTRVDTVIPYYNRFIEEIPTIQKLAAIEEDRLLKLWQGLGYYNRALNLKKAARRIVEEFDGIMPSEVKDLMTLPGIGEYSSGAIASIAFGKKVPAIDGNVLRIVARITGSREDIGSIKTKELFRPVVLSLLPEVAVGDFNQALMDLGATICLPNGSPKCAECPVQGYCLAHKDGLVSELPVKTRKKIRVVEEKTVLVISLENRLAIRKRDGGGLLPNLFEFPNLPGHLTEQECKEAVETLGVKALEIKGLNPVRHIFTHLEWKMKGYFVEVELKREQEGLIWATREEIDTFYSIPTAFKGFLKDCCGE